MRESVSNLCKGEVSKLSRELILCGDAWDTIIHLYICVSVRIPGRICQQPLVHPQCLGVSCTVLCTGGSGLGA